MTKSILLLMLLLLFVTGQAGADEEQNYFDFVVLPGVPVPLAGPFAGADGSGNLIVAGGIEGENGTGGVASRVFVLPSGSAEWREVDPLPEAAGSGASVSTPRGLFGAGGMGADGLLRSDVFLLEWTGDVLLHSPLTPLPVPLSGIAAASQGSLVYVYGLNPAGEAAFLSLDTSADGAAWEELPRPPASSVSRPAMAAFGPVVFLIGGEGATGEAAAESYAYTATAGWREIRAAPLPLAGVFAAACGEAHLTVLGAGADPSAILAYHTVTNTWAPSGRLLGDPGILSLDSSGLNLTIIGNVSTVRASARLIPTKYGWIDHGVVVLYLSGMLLIGAFLARREKGTNDFFRGGRRIPWWASGLSMFATGASAISLMAMPGKSYSGDWTYFSLSIFAIMVLPLSMFVYAPVVRRLNISTANEYLERRFNLTTRLFGASVYSLNQMLGRMATIMLLPAIALSSIVGIPIEQSILIMGVVTTIYVTAGGLSAVIWTDVVQAIVMIASVLLCVIWALVLITGDAATAFQAIGETNKLRIFDWDPDLTRATALAMFLNTVFGTTGMLGDQNFIQRVQCTATEKQAKRAVASQIAVAVPLNVILFTLGTVLFLFYRENPGELNPAVQADGIFPLFAAQQLPPGIAGLVVAALLAATMSTLSSAVNSTSNLGVDDFYRRLVPGVTDAQCMRLARGLSVVLGILGTGAALLLAKTGLDSVWDLAILVMGLIGAPMVGIFALGIFTTRANAVGVLIGSACCISMTIILRFNTDLNGFYYLPFGSIVCFVTGLAASYLTPTAPEKVDGLTAYTLLGKNSKKEDLS